METKLPTEIPEDSLDESLNLLRRHTVIPHRRFLADFLELAKKDFIEGWKDQENCYDSLSDHNLRDEGHTKRSDAYKEGYYRCNLYRFSQYYDFMEDVNEGHV